MNTGFVFDVALHKIKLLLTSFNHLTFARELLQHSIGRSVFDALKLAIEARSCLAKVGYLFCMGYPQASSTFEGLSPAQLEQLDDDSLCWLRQS